MLMQEERELVVEYGKKDERRPVEHRNQRQYPVFTTLKKAWWL